MKEDKKILLSAVVVVGSCRERAQRVLDDLCSQTVVDSIEIIVVDIASNRHSKLATLPDARVVYVSSPANKSWARARAEGFRQASAPVVAFIEDHCYPASRWAEALIEAHKGPWVAVGYAFTNANPESYISRACMIIDYGFFAHPVQSGPARFLPGNNVSYKRDVLLEFGDQLESVLTPDFNIQEIFSKRGFPMYIESRALAAHENYIRLSGAASALYTYCRMMAVNRARTQSWGILRRLIYFLGTPVGSPSIGIFRMVRSLPGRRSLWWGFFISLPVIYITYQWASFGEALGYLFGEGTAERDLIWWEVEAERATAS